MRRALSFHLTPWDNVKSATSLCPPTPTSLPYAEELAPPLATGVGGWGSRLSTPVHHTAACPEKWRRTDNSAFTVKEKTELKIFSLSFYRNTSVHHKGALQETS